MRQEQHHRCLGAIIGLVALYAVLLQSFLTVATPGVFLRELGILCLDQGSDGSTDGPAVHHDHTCCTLAHAKTLVPPCSVAVAATPRPMHIAVVVWRPEAAIPRTGPPTYAKSARGPPLA